MALSEMLNIIVALLGLTLSVIAICISIATFRKQTRMSLFEKRFDIYYACQLVCGLCSIGEPNLVADVLYNRKIKCSDNDIVAAQFLFNKKTHMLISEIFSKWTLMRDYHDAYHSNVDFKVKYEQLKKWFTYTKGTLNEDFRKYLDMRETK